MTLTDEVPQQSSSKDFLDAEMPTVSDQPEEHRRPLQLPRVGWSNDDDVEGETNTNIANAEHLTDAPVLDRAYEDKDTSRRLSQSSRVELDLESIPEDLSMHGTWPDYYPDILGCCEYDHDRKKYTWYGSEFKRRMGVIFLIVIVALIGSKYPMRSAGKQNQQSITMEDPDTINQVDQKKQHLPEVDLYETIVDSLQPIMFDGYEFQLTFFHAFEFCGAEYNRIPCPYIAYCPLGPGHAPLGGTKISVAESWAPVYNSGGDNNPHKPDWVQLGRDGTCQLYSKLYNEPPQWDTQGSTDQTKDVSWHVMCCMETVDGTFKGDADRGPSNDPYHLHRPPSLEEDELKYSTATREDEEGKTVDQSSKSGGNRIL